MWTCPICNESSDGFEPEGHAHYFLHYLPPNDNGDWLYCGTSSEKIGLNQFVETVAELLSFEGESSRYEALDSLDRAFSRLPKFPVPLRDLIKTCLDHQADAMGETEEGCEMVALVPDLHEYLERLLVRCTINLQTTSFFNPSDPGSDWDEPATVYWTEHPETAVLDCTRRLEEDVTHLKCLQLKGSRFRVVH